MAEADFRGYRSCDFHLGLHGEGAYYPLSANLLVGNSAPPAGSAEYDKSPRVTREVDQSSKLEEHSAKLACRARQKAGVKLGAEELGAMNGHRPDEFWSESVSSIASNEAPRYLCAAAPLAASDSSERVEAMGKEFVMLEAAKA